MQRASPSTPLALFNNSQMLGDGSALVSQLQRSPTADPRLFDVTLLLRYRGLVNGKDYVSVPNPHPDPNGFGPGITMNSFFIVAAPVTIEEPAPSSSSSSSTGGSATLSSSSSTGSAARRSSSSSSSGSDDVQPPIDDGESMSRDATRTAGIAVAVAAFAVLAGVTIACVRRYRRARTLQQYTRAAAGTSEADLGLDPLPSPGKRGSSSSRSSASPGDVDVLR